MACFKASVMLRQAGETCIAEYAPAYREPALSCGQASASDGKALHTLFERAMEEKGGRVVLLDASGVIRHTTPLHGGNAHSDIYKWEVGYILWQAIKTFTPTRAPSQ